VANRYWVGGTDTWDATAGSKWSTTSGGAGGSAVPTTADTVFFDAASGAGTVTLGTTGACQTINFTGYTGTFAWGTNTITVAGNNATIYTQTTSCTFTGTPVLNCTYSGSTGTRIISIISVTEANSPSFNISAGSDTLTISSISSVKNLNFTGFSGSTNSNTKTIYGNLTLSTGMTVTAGTAATTFAATSGTQTITSNTKTIDCPITFSGTATYQLADALTSGSTRNMTLTSGTLDLNNKTLTTGTFSSINSNTRSILFGTTGNITCSGTGTVWTTSTITGFSYTGTSTVNLTNSSATTRTVTQGAGTAAQAVSIYVKAGTGAVNFGGTLGPFQNIDFTGSSAIFTLGNSIALYGNLLIPSTATVGATVAGLNVLGTTGTQQITSGANVFDFNIGISGGSIIQLVDALTMGSTRNLTFTSGTLDLNDKTVTTGTFSSTNSNTRAILFGTTGSFNIVGNNATIFNMATATNFTYTGTPTVNLTYSGSVGTRTVSVGNGAGGSQATALDYNVSAGSDIVSIFIHYRNLDFTGFTGTCTNNTRVIYGNLTLVSGMTLGGGTLITTFASTLLQQNITTAAKTIDSPITLSGTQTYQLQDALTMGVTRTLTFTSGTLDLNNKTLTTNTFSSSNSNVRLINFGTLGEINLVGTSGTIWTTSNNANFSVTGTPTVNVTDTSVGNTRTLNQGTGVSNQAVSFYVKAGSGTVLFTTTGGTFQTIDLTGFSGTVGHSSIFVLGDYVIPAGVTVNSTANAIQFVGTAATQKITTSSNVMDFPITIGRALATTAATGNGTTATLTFSSTAYYPIVGQVITVSGVVPAGYNGTFTVTASSLTTVSYLNTTTAAQTTAGTVNLATTVQLQDALTMGARQLTYSSGTLDLNNNTLTTQNVSASALTPRTILFGTAEINVTGSNTTIWTNSNATGYPFIATGTKVVNCTYSGSVGARNISCIMSTPDLYSLNFNITAGSDIFSIQGNRQYNNINFTGFSGTCVVSSTSTANASIYGNWTCPASGAGIFLSSTTPYGLAFQSIAGNTQTLTSNGYIFDCPIVKTGSTTGTLLLADDLVVTDATSSGTITLTNGIFNSNGKNVTCAVFDAENTNTKTFTITNSTFTVTGGSSTEGFIFQSGNTTWNVTGSNIVFTTSGTAVYYGGIATSVTFPQVTMSGSGQLIVGYINSTTSITTLTNTVQPCTVSVSTTSQLTVTNFNLNGTAGNLVTFNSNVPGTARTVTKASGTVNAQYLAIQDSNATGGATWNAYYSTNNGNNTGWNFVPYLGNFFTLFDKL
jgi:hypothetical protein